MNNYFANVVTSLEIPEFENIDQISENISQPSLKAIVKYRNYPSITTINQAFPYKYFNVSIIEKIFLIRLWNLNIKRLPKTLTFLSMFWKRTPFFLPNIFTYSLMKQLNHQSFFLRWNQPILRQFSKKVAETRRELYTS